jgi:predicted NACHT family NTPase
MGEAGAGKTTCMQMFTINRKEENSRIYIYLPLSRVIQNNEHRKQRNEELRIEREIVNYLLSSGVSLNLIQFQNLIKVKKTTLLLDGLDEAIKKAPWLIADITKLSGNYADNLQIITTARSSGNYDLPFFNITLLPFTNEQKFHFIDCWFSTSESHISENIKKHLRKNSSLSELVNNPLLTTILCVLAEHQLPLPTTELRLYNDRMDLLTGYYDNVKNISRTLTPPDILKNLAQKLAFHLHSRTKREEDIRELEKISIKLMLNSVRKDTAINALRELVDPCNILVPMSCVFRFIRTPIPVLSGHFLGLRFLQK